MGSKIKKFVLLLSGITIAATLLFIIYNIFHSEPKTDPPSISNNLTLENPDIPSPSSNEMLKFLDKIKIESDVKQQIIASHARFNEITGWKNLENLDQVTWERYKNLNFLQDELYIKMSNVVSDDRIKLDLMNTAKLVRYAKDNFNPDAIVYAHRIIHDLDLYVLATGAENLKDKDKFGASFALPEHKQAEIIKKWIEENIR